MCSRVHNRVYKQKRVYKQSVFEETFSCEKPPDTNGQNVSVGQNNTFESKMDVLFQKAFEMCFGDFGPKLTKF